MNKFQMDPSHRELLREKRVELVQNLILNDHFMAIMMARKIFTDNMHEEIDIIKIRSRKAAQFLDLLVRRGPKAFEVFIEALVATDQAVIAEALDEHLAQKYMCPDKAVAEKKVQPPVQESQQQSNAEKLSKEMDDDEPPLLSTYIDRMIKVTPAQAENLLSNSKVYPTKGYLRGRALIINISKFDDPRLQKRVGAEFDSANLFHLFQAMYYDTTLKENITAQEILDVLKAESQNSMHKDADSFLLCVLSHGAQGKVYGFDGKHVEVSSILSFFDGRHCKDLLNKPKAFIIQACQGVSETKGITQCDSVRETDDEKPEESNTDARPLDDEVSRALENLRIYDEAGNTPDPKSHEMADTLVAYATVPGYKSYRQTTHGSWFIRTLIKEMCRSAHNEHLVDILTMVRNEVMKLRTNEMIFGKPHNLQLTETRETLLRKWYFLPGYPPQNSMFH